MSEMALTADHLVVIGRGRLIADATDARLLSRGAATSCWSARPTRRLAALARRAGAARRVRRRRRA